MSTKLAQQVLGALHDLLRGLHAADIRANGTRIRTLAAEHPEHLYEGLLTVLMRLIFVLYAEDRGLFPNSEVWVRNYSLGGLFARLREDFALYPDTMDDRFGAWSQLVALWRIVQSGGRHGEDLRLITRRGRLFDSDRFLFLEGRDHSFDPPDPPPVSDAVVWNILQRLLVLEGERLSYRSLDVEQIGSVYETMIGFTVQLTKGHSLAVRSGKAGGASVIVDLDELLNESPAKRPTWLQSRTDRKPTDKAARNLRDARTFDDLAAALTSLQDKEATPQVVLPAVPVLQPTEERRRSGSHYTPRSLTEPIVRQALRPVLERLGPSPTPDQILELKVLDPAMGCAAFLVEACRQLGESLVAAWASHNATPALPPDEHTLLHAYRLIAQRCLYGVDRNPVAAELGKLSLWLFTLARDHEFTFVDHAIRHGDSLVGLTRAEIERPDGRGLRLGPSLIAERLAEAAEARDLIRTAPDDAKQQTILPILERADQALEPVRRVGDALIASFFSAGKHRDRERNRFELVQALDRGGSAAEQTLETFAHRLDTLEFCVRPFHWEIEFPEVFQRESAGFDVIVGNPPFAGKVTISAGNGPYYIDWLQTIHEGSHGNADLVAHFFRRAYQLLRTNGTFGLIATNTVAQGDTRATGLRWIRQHGGTIYATRRRFPWPGHAAVIVSIVHVARGFAPQAYLDGHPVERITAFLVNRGGDDDPSSLAANRGVGFVGSYVLGMGFTFDDTDAKEIASPLAHMRELIARDPRNAERIKPYIGGEEVNSDPGQRPHRWVIDFEGFPLRRTVGPNTWASMIQREREVTLRSGVVPFDYPDSVAADWPDLLAIVEARVRPGRARGGDESSRRYWWRYFRQATRLYAATAGNNRVLVLSRVSKHCAFCFLPTSWIYAHSMTVFKLQDYAAFAVLQSRVHETWARFFSSSMRDDIRYSLTDAFETFPRPPDGTALELELVGRAYYERRAALMAQYGIGLTNLYNRFNDPKVNNSEIADLRRIHADLDAAVLAAYGWHDLAAEAVFEREYANDDDDASKLGGWRLRWPESTRDEVLGHLITLNRDRAAIELLPALDIVFQSRNK